MIIPGLAIESSYFNGYGQGQSMPFPHLPGFYIFLALLALLYTFSSMKNSRNMHLQRICDNIYLVEAPEQGRFPYCNGFLFTGDENILIDAGMDDEQIRGIDSSMDIDTLVISHTHPDHIRRWHLLSHRRILLPAESPDSVFNMETLAARYVGSPEKGRHWIEVIGKLTGLRALREPDARFTSGDIIENGTSRIEAIHAPGHLDDHYCFFEHNTGTLFSTDIDFTGFGPWYGNPEGKIKPFMESIRGVMKLPYKRVCTSHKPPHEGDATSRFESYLAAFTTQKMKVLAAIGKGKTLEELTAVSPFYNNRFMDLKLQNYFEEHMISENLAMLIEEGLVHEDGGMFIAAH
ncbi:MAG TPA: MBL fold metallo-hydrolase [Spirochaetota bacterium]|nr:MBL fold metallo-hydrolase [Spirochaetota bacterium]